MATQQNQNDKAVWELNPIPFESTVQTDFTDSHMFCKNIIYPIFSKVWPDFYGSKIEVNQNRFIALAFYFAEPDYVDPNSDKIKALEKTFDKQQMDINAKFRKINNEQNNRVQDRYKLSKTAMDILEELVPTQQNKINWKAVVSEGSFNTPGNQQNAKSYVRVMVDINRVVRKIFGPRDPKTGEEYQYLTLLGNPISPMQAQGGNVIIKNWQLVLIRGSVSAVKALAERYGMPMDSLDVVRG